MAIYWINLCLNFIYLYIYIKTLSDSKRRTKNIILNLSILQMILIVGLRDYSIGNDTPIYFRYFSNYLNNSGNILMNSNFEYGFNICTKIVTELTNNYTIYLIIIAVLSLMPMKEFFLNSTNPIFSIIIYICLGFYAFIFSGLRQAIAIAVVLSSYKYIKEKKLIKYLCIILLATLFHFSALLFLPAYFVNNIKLSKIKIVIICIIDVLIYIFKIPIYNFISRYFYDNYPIVVTDSYMWMIMCILIVSVLLLVYKKAIDKDEANIGLYNLVIIGVSIMLFAPIANNIMRIANYYFIFVVLLIPNVINTLQKPKLKFVLTSLSLVILSLIYIYLLNVDSYSIVPYYFFYT